MANGLKHATQGSVLTQTEYEAEDTHVFESQATGDILYASSSSVLRRLAIGSTGAVLTVTGGVPVWDTTWTPTGHLIPSADDSYDLGSASAAWQDLFLEGDITLTDAGTLATSGGALTITSAAAATWSTSAGALTLNGTGGVALQEGGSPIISISDARAITTANTASIALDATGVIELNSSGGALSIGNDNVDQTINIATAGTRTLNIGIGDGTDITTTVVKGTLSVGVDDAGYDVVFYGDTASANMTWDTSVDDLILNGAARIVIPDGQLVLGSTAVSSTAAELNVLDGVTAGTAAASKAVVLDGSKNIATIGTIGSGAITSTGTSSFGAASFSGLITANGGITFADGDDITFTGGTGTNDIVLGNGLADALSITDGSADIIAISTAGGTNTVAITGDLTVSGSLSADTATVASTVTITDNESTNEDNAIIFTSGGDLDGGNIGLESDGDLHYNPSTGTLTASTFAGNLTGNASGTAATVTGGTQASITTVANVTEVGALDAGSITSNFGNIDIGSNTFDTTGAVATGALTAGGIIKTDDSTNATSTTDGSLQTDGGLSVVLDAVFGDDVTLITDSAVLNLGVGSDVKLTHDGTTGGTLSGTPMVVEGLGAASLANDTHAGVVLEFLAAESIAVGQLVYMSTTDARVGLADANVSGKYPAIGVAVSAQGSAGSAVKILTHGTFNDSDGFGGDLTEGNVLYLSETAGGFTATAPSDDGDRVQVVGVAIGPRDVFINPSLDVIEHD